MKKVLSVILSIIIVLCAFGITASADSIKYGDSNDDNTIDNKDYAVLMQYINGWNVTINVSSSDVNIDNIVDNKDYALLMQYLNGWDVKLGEKQPNPNTVNPEDYRGTTVTFATTVLSQTNEAGPVIEGFEKKYGIAVNEILVGDNINEIAGKIASGVNVDIMCCKGDFPAALAVLQPLTIAKLNYNDPIWDKNMFDFSSLNGKPYLCNTIGNIWAENACVLYSKNMLNQAQCYTPEEYDHVGKWTWDSFFEIATCVDKLDGDIGYYSDIQGCYISVEDMLGSVGCGVYSYNDGKFSNGLNNNFHKEAIHKLAKLYRGISASSSATFDTVRNTFFKGKVGICIANTQMLKKCEVRGATIDWFDIGFYKMPAYETGYQVNDTNRVVGWGICRGSDNPVGAGIFLRYYLDVNNYDVSNSFITTAAENFFFTSTAIDYEKYTPYFTYEYSTQNLTGFYEYDWEELTRIPEDYINRDYPVLSTHVDDACNILNKFVEKNTH